MLGVDAEYQLICQAFSYVLDTVSWEECCFKRGRGLILMHKVISLKKSQFILFTGRLFCLGDTCCGLKNCFSIDYNVASSFLMLVVVHV